MIHHWHRCRLIFQVVLCHCSLISVCLSVMLIQFFVYFLIIHFTCLPLCLVNKYYYTWIGSLPLAWRTTEDLQLCFAYPGLPSGVLRDVCRSEPPIGRGKIFFQLFRFEGLRPLFCCQKCSKSVIFCQKIRKWEGKRQYLPASNHYRTVTDTVGVAVSVIFVNENENWNEKILKTETKLKRKNRKRLKTKTKKSATKTKNSTLQD